MFTTVLKSLCKDVQCCVSVNGVKSRWFDVGVGLKQGCMLSPLLFNLYISDLPKVLTVSGNGITCGSNT